MILRTYQQIKSDLQEYIEGCENIELSLEDALTNIKSSIEDVIRVSGNTGKGNLIRTKKLINLLHEVVKSEFVKLGVNPDLIKPRKGFSNGELKVAGILKSKDQDIALLPNNITPTPEVLSNDGILKGYTDELGHSYTEKVLTVNVRSQLSSFAKNFDTLYERTFAETFNLHKRCPKMVLGEFYMIAVNEYDTEDAKNKSVSFTQTNNIERHIEKYLLAFDAINSRKSISEDLYKYEKVCLLIVDFDTLTVYNSDEQLKENGLLPLDSLATIENLTFDSFFKDLLEVYKTRFGTGRFT